MKTLLLTLALSASVVAGPLKMRPGLWEVNMDMKDGKGQEVSASKQLEAALAKMPKEKRKEVEAMMARLGSGGLGAGKGGIRICYSDKMISDPQSIVNNQNKQCQNTIVSQTESEVKTTFTCKDGTKGDSHWKYQVQSYSGVVNMDSPKRGKSTMNYAAKFVSNDCGKVKPLEARK